MPGALRWRQIAFLISLSHPFQLSPVWPKEAKKRCIMGGYNAEPRALIMSFSCTFLDFGGAPGRENQPNEEEASKRHSTGPAHFAVESLQLDGDLPILLE